MVHTPDNYIQDIYAKSDQKAELNLPKEPKPYLLVTEGITSGHQTPGSAFSALLVLKNKLYNPDIGLASPSYCSRPWA